MCKVNLIIKLQNLKKKEKKIPNNRRLELWVNSPIETIDSYYNHKLNIIRPLLRRRLQKYLIKIFEPFYIPKWNPDGNGKYRMIRTLTVGLPFNFDDSYNSRMPKKEYTLDQQIEISNLRQIERYHGNDRTDYNEICTPKEYTRAGISLNSIDYNILFNELYRKKKYGNVKKSISDIENCNKNENE